MIECNDSLAYLKGIEEYGNDIIYCDPPYALGSTVGIRKDGKVDYIKSADFMNKWEMPTGEYWEKWFVEAFRTLKHGGYLVMFGMDRQLLLFKYYACLAGFVEQQSLYWYFISNFPKATDLSKMIDKNLGLEREVVGQQEMFGTARKVKGKNGHGGKTSGANNEYDETTIDITKPSSDLAKKYEGYKYSISPLKQTNETIMVFQKPCKTGSPLHDCLAYENGDNTISVSALNIDGNRVGTEKVMNGNGEIGKNVIYSNLERNEDSITESTGRYPAQTFIDSQVAERLDLQSGVSGGGKYKEANDRVRNNGIGLGESEDRSGMSNAPDNYGDIGGCSKILHKCDYTSEDYDLYNYEPKVSSSERNAGCDDIQTNSKFDKNTSSNDKHDSLNSRCSVCGDRALDCNCQCSCGANDFVRVKMNNNHPTLKPIALNEKILKLFKTPNDQRICYAFAGAGSEIIGGIKAGFDNWCGCEISQEYVDIANARIKYWKEEMTTQTSIFDFID